MNRIEYAGGVWTQNKAGYYSAPRGWPGESFLHRQIHVDEIGPIPDGFLVHHTDEDKTNNDPGNLVAVSRKDHAALHPAARLRSPEWLAHLATIREAAKAWHSTPEGRAWHAAHGRATWEGRERAESRPCSVCGDQFEPFHDRAETCSKACHAAARRAAGVDDEDRACVWCGGAFRVNRFRPQETCGRSCGGKLSAARRAR